MEKIRKEIINHFGHKLRIRVCGILIENDKILLAKHHSIGETDILWAPPGGGIEFGEYAEDALIREFKEETGIDIYIESFLCVQEFLAPPLHAIELFFHVKKKHGDLTLGYDPELSPENQIITAVEWLNYEVLNQLNPHSKHAILKNIDNLNDLLNITGFRKGK